jgi:hypothetical protein
MMVLSSAARCVGRRGADVRWRVVTNSSGRIKKVLYTPVGRRLPGWYCHLVVDIAAEGELSGGTARAVAGRCIGCSIGRKWEGCGSPGGTCFF